MKTLCGYLSLLFFFNIVTLSNPVHAAKAVVVFKKFTCKQFVAQGPDGFYVMEYQGGFDPQEGDFIVGNFNSYGFKQAYYPDKEQEGKVYVNGFKMNEDSAFRAYFEHCY